MRILHVLDHSLPVQSGYAFRSDSILREQRALGWETLQVTSPKHGPYTVAAEEIDGLSFFRTPASTAWPARISPLDQWAVVRALRRRVRDLVREFQPDLIQAHSPCLNGLAALGLGVPMIYELRSSWEDAAVSTGATREGSLRYRLSRALETHVLRRARAATTVCEGFQSEAPARGVGAGRIPPVPKAGGSAEISTRGGGAP